MARSPNEGLYNSLYDKDMGLMRKLMNLDEFQCPGNVSHNNNGIGAPGNNNDINASKQHQQHQQQFHQYSNGVFNGKFPSTPNFPFPFEKQPSTNGGLLKPCYDFPSKAELDNDGFGTLPISTGGFKKQQQQQQGGGGGGGGGFTSSGFINQFPHESLFGANNHHSNFAKLNEINNNNGGGIVIKMENGISVNDFNALQMNNKTNELLCPRSSNTLNKTEPNEFRNSSCKGNAGGGGTGEEEEQKPSTLNDDSNDGFTQL